MARRGPTKKSLLVACVYFMSHLLTIVLQRPPLALYSHVDVKKSSLPLTSGQVRLTLLMIKMGLLI